MSRWRWLVVGAAAWALASGEVHAQANVFWTGASSGGDDFGNGGNWLSGTVPANNGTKILGFFSSNAMSPNGNQMNLNVGVDVLGLDAEADKTSGGGANISISSANADSLTIGASGIEMNQTASHSVSVMAISAPVILSADQSWTLTASELSFSAPISESNSGTKVHIVDAGGSLGQVTLESGASTFSGGVTVTGSGAEVEIPASSSGPAGSPTSGPVGTGTLTLGNGTALIGLSSATLTLGNNIVIGTTSGVSSANLLSVSGTLQLTGVISDSSTGTGKLELIGLGQLDLEGANTYSGGTDILGASAAGTTLTVGNDQGLGTGAVTSSLATINFTSSMPGSGIPSFSFSQSTVNFSHSSATVSLTDAVLNASTLNFTQAGDEVTLTSPTLNTGSVINFGNDAVVSITDLAADTDASNQINLGTNSVLSMRVDGAEAYHGTITGTGSNVSFITANTGVLDLYGANTYSSGTTIGSNVLVIADSSSGMTPSGMSYGPLGTGSISLNGGGASLGVASGVTITNAISTFSNGSVIEGYGTVAPGSSFFLTDSHGKVLVGGKGSSPLGGFASSQVPGTLTFGANVGNIALGNQGIIQFSIMNATGTPGVDYSAINAPSANVDVTALSKSPFVIQLVSVSPTTGQLGLANFNSSTPYTWTLLSALSITNFAANSFVVDDTTDFQNALGGGFFSVSESGGNALTLSFTPVPEPSTWALMATGLCALGAAVRRRRR